MTKKRSISLFVLFAILLVICLIASFVNFTYPLSVGGNYYSYSNFVSNLRLGEDISSSVRIIYNAEPKEDEDLANYDNLRAETMHDLKQIVQDQGYADVTIAEYGDQQIVINVGNILNKEDQDTVINLIENLDEVAFSTNSDGSSPFAKREAIKNVEPMQYNDPETGKISYIVTVEFKEEFHQVVAEKSKGKTVYIHLGTREFASLNYSDGEITNGVIYLQSTSINSMLDAQTVANQIKTGMMSLKLTAHKPEVITPTYGVGSSVMLTIAIALFIVAAFVFLAVKYKHMGWIANFAMLFFVTIGLFFLQSIPFVHINLGGIIAMLVLFTIAVDSIMTILEKTREYYQNDTKLYIAFKIALKESLAKILFTNALVLVTGFVCLFMPTLAVQSFGWVALVLSVVSVFVSLVLMRLFIKMYLALNSTNGEKCNFHKGGKNA